MSFVHNQRSKKHWRENKKKKTVREYNYLHEETMIRYKEGK